MADSYLASIASPAQQPTASQRRADGASITRYTDSVSMAQVGSITMLGFSVSEPML